MKRHTVIFTSFLMTEAALASFAGCGKKTAEKDPFVKNYSMPQVEFRDLDTLGPEELKGESERLLAVAKEIQGKMDAMRMEVSETLATMEDQAKARELKDKFVKFYDQLRIGKSKVLRYCADAEDFSVSVDVLQAVEPTVDIGNLLSNVAKVQQAVESCQYGAPEKTGGQVLADMGF